MYGPAVRYKPDFQDNERELHQCIRPLEWSALLRAIMGIRAHPRLLGERPQRAKLAPSLLVAPGRPFIHLFIPSRRPRRECC
jgi:hypothetical protein